MPNLLVVSDSESFSHSNLISMGWAYLTRLSSENLKISLYSVTFLKKMARGVKPSRRSSLLFIWNIFRCDEGGNRPKKKIYFSMQNYRYSYIYSDFSFTNLDFVFSKWTLGWNYNPKSQELAYILHLKEHHPLDFKIGFQIGTVALSSRVLFPVV